jgi:hypothetical protein
MRSVAKHRHRVAEPEDLLHAVADVNRGDTLRTKSRDELVQPLSLVLREAARGLVEHDDARASADRRCDLQHLLLPGRQLPDALAHVQLCANRREHGLRTRPHLGPGEKTAPRRQRSETEVLGDRQILAKGELLVNHPNARRQRVLRPAKRHRPAEENDPALIRRMDACQDLSEGALPGTILAAERVTGTFDDGEADILERTRARKALRDAFELNRRNCHHLRNCQNCLSDRRASSGVMVSRRER